MKKERETRKQGERSTKKKPANLTKVANDKKSNRTELMTSKLLLFWRSTQSKAKKNAHLHKNCFVFSSTETTSGLNERGVDLAKE